MSGSFEPTQIWQPCDKSLFIKVWKKRKLKIEYFRCETLSNSLSICRYINSKIALFWVFLTRRLRVVCEKKCLASSCCFPTSCDIETFRMSHVGQKLNSVVPCKSLISYIFSQISLQFWWKVIKDYCILRIIFFDKQVEQYPHMKVYWRRNIWLKAFVLE